MEQYAGKIFWVCNSANSTPDDIYFCDTHFTKLENLIFDSEASFIQFFIPKINDLKRSYTVVLKRDTIGDRYTFEDSDLSISCEIFENRSKKTYILYGNWYEGESFSWTVIIERITL